MSSFASDLYTIMNGDASLNASFDGGIYYENLPDNFDLDKKWLMYYFNKEEQFDTFGCKNVYTQYGVTAVIINQNTEDVNTLSDQLVDYINSKSQGGIQDIYFTSDGHAFDREKNVYMNTLQFEAIYV